MYLGSPELAHFCPTAETVQQKYFLPVQQKYLSPLVSAFRAGSPKIDCIFVFVYFTFTPDERPSDRWRAHFVNLNVATNSH